LVKFGLVDRTLGLEIEDPLLPLVQTSWLPRNTSAGNGARDGVIRVVRGSTRAVTSGLPTLKLGSASLWMSDTGDAAWLAGEEGCSGTLDLRALRADLVTPGTPDARAGIDLYPMLTISAALLLGRSGRALVHAAAVVPPEGSAWMFVGDARSGKSTTTANLITRGWNYLSDDQVVLSREPDGAVRVNGLLRHFHMDEGWGTGSPVQRRRTVDAATVGSGRPVEAAPLGALWFPHVSAREPTLGSPVAAADAMAALVRQSPWLLADRVAAPRLLDLLTTATAYPRYELRLGLDTFGDGELLENIMVRGNR
jgi:hypothetical protein